MVDSKKICTACNGKGKFLTPFGMALVKLMDEWSLWHTHLGTIKDLLFGCGGWIVAIVIFVIWSGQD